MTPFQGYVTGVDDLLDSLYWTGLHPVLICDALSGLYSGWRRCSDAVVKNFAC